MHVVLLEMVYSSPGFSKESMPGEKKKKTGSLEIVRMEKLRPGDRKTLPQVKQQGYTKAFPVPDSVLTRSRF